MIRLENVSKQYGNFFAVKDLNFEIKKGEVIGFLGKNGAGKTTTMNIITGFIEASNGKVFIDGIDIDKKPSKAKAKIGYMPENAPLYADLTVEEFVRYMAELKGVQRKDVKDAVEKVIKEVGLEEVRNRLTRNISRGFKQRVSLAGALVGSPEILILDEPTDWLDPKQVVEIRNLIKKLGKKYTILLSSHILSEVNQICEKVIIINNGQIVAIDTPENLENTVKKDVQTVKITVDEKEKTIKDLKDEIEGIKRIKEIESNEESLEKKYLIEYEGSEDFRKTLFEICPKHDITILELSKENVSLEDAFIDIVDKDKKTAKERIINKREEKKLEDKRLYEEIKKEIEEEDKARAEKKKKRQEAKKKGGKK